VQLQELATEDLEMQELFLAHLLAIMITIQE